MPARGKFPYLLDALERNEGTTCEEEASVAATDSKSNASRTGPTTSGSKLNRSAIKVPRSWQRSASEYLAPSSAKPLLTSSCKLTMIRPTLWS